MTQVRIRRVEDGAGDLIRASVSIWLVDAETRRRVAWHSAGGPITEITNLALNTDRIVALVPQADIALDASGAPTRYHVRVVAQPETRRPPVGEDWYIQVPDSVDVLDLADLVGAASIGADSLVAARLLPLGATSGQMAAMGGSGAWVAIDPPSGIGDMQALIYDPNGVASNVFDLGNLDGNLDGGTFN